MIENAAAVPAPSLQTPDTHSCFLASSSLMNHIMGCVLTPPAALDSAKLSTSRLRLSAAFSLLRGWRRLGTGGAVTSKAPRTCALQGHSAELGRGFRRPLNGKTRLDMRQLSTLAEIWLSAFAQTTSTWVGRLCAAPTSIYLAHYLD